MTSAGSSIYLCHSLSIVNSFSKVVTLSLIYGKMRLYIYNLVTAIVTHTKLLLKER